MIVPGPGQSKQSPTGLLKEEREEEAQKKRYEYLAWEDKYQKKYWQFLQLDPNNFTVTKAVYITESAYYDYYNTPTYKQFEDSIKRYAALVKQIIKREGLSDTNNTAIMYCYPETILQQPNLYYDSTTRKGYTVPQLPLRL